MSTLKSSRFPFTLQCTYPDDPDSFCSLLQMLSDHGFYGVEVNVKNLETISPECLTKRIRSFGLHLTYLATGVYSGAHGYSLSSSSDEIRRASIAGCKENIHYAAECGCGVIIGFFKNNPLIDVKAPEVYLEESLHELVPVARSLHVPLLLEATNHYESKIANSLGQAAALAQRAGSDTVSILPDTYHMNIEESDPLGALDTYNGLFQNIHFSDNNRFFPGFGCIQFRKYLEKLVKLHYTGTIGIEGNLKYGYARDLAVTAAYLSEMSQNLIQISEPTLSSLCV